MQVRKNLQNKKSQVLKGNKILLFFDSVKVKKKSKHLKASKSKSRSKQNKQKQLSHNKKHRSKSKQNVSPIKIKKVNLLNNSPVLYSQKKQKTPSRVEAQSNKVIHSHRGPDCNSHLISTKLNTERTPIKKCKQQHIKTKSSTNKKTKKGLKKQLNQIQNSKEKENNRIIVETERSNKTFKKVIPEINTLGPQRKQSYFDDHIMEKLELDKANYMRRRKNYIKKQNINSNHQVKFKQHNTKNDVFNSVTYKQYGTTTDTQLGSYQNNLKEIQSFRKQQQLKWKIVYHQLNELKNTRTPEKINQILQDTDKNIQQFQFRSKQIIYSSSVKNNYVIQSPAKIKQALQKSKKSIQQNQQMVKTLSEQKLLQQLQIFEIFDNFGPQNNYSQQKQQKQSSLFCLELQKQLQSYPQSNIPQNKFFNSQQIHHIPQLQYQKSQQILACVQQKLILEFCDNLADNQKLFHNFLVSSKNPNNEKIDFEQQKINCTDYYTANLVVKLFHFIVQNQYTDQVLKEINTAFGNEPLTNLKWLRNYFVENQQQVFEDDQDIQPILSNQILGQFQQKQMICHNEGQYFYHHCVYSALNQILDSIRPFGCSGLPPMQSQARIIHRKISAVQQCAKIKLQQILRVKMGRVRFKQQETDPTKLVQKSYELMDRFLIREEQQKWQRPQDLIFQEKYLMAESIINYIFNQEILMVYNEFT